jgi:hypothetical protein
MLIFLVLLSVKLLLFPEFTNSYLFTLPKGLYTQKHNYNYGFGIIKNLEFATNNKIEYRGENNVIRYQVRRN